MNINPIEIYNTAVKRVPAYKDFLIKKRKGKGKAPFDKLRASCLSTTVKTLEDFKELPFTSKKEYILKYPVEKISLDGTLLGKHFIYRSSGASGNPVYWPKLPEEEKDMPRWLGLGLEEAHNISKIPTLIIVGLGLGSWISGEQTSWAMRSLAVEGAGITVITPGTDIREIIDIMKRFCPSFPQTLLISYPPFAKTIIEEALKEKLPLKKYNLKLGLVGEGYSEHYRDYMGKLLGHKPQDIMAIWSGYGSADFGGVGRETPLTIVMRRILHKKKLARKILFCSVLSRPVPTICQYSPAAQYIESVNGELVITKFQAVPLVRYKTGDRGDVIGYKDMLKRFNSAGIDIINEVRKLGFKGELAELPFVIVYGRIDGSVSFYGANITVEQIKGILETSPLSKYFTGKFKMGVKPDKKLNPVFEITLEVKVVTGRDRTLQKDNRKTSKIIAAQLCEINSEYRNTVKVKGKSAYPKVKFINAGADSKGIKIRYV